MLRWLKYFLQIGELKKYDVFNENTLYKLYIDGVFKGYFKISEVMRDYNNNPNCNIVTYSLREMVKEIYIRTK